MNFKPGYYEFPYNKGELMVFVVVGAGWEHVAVVTVIAGNQHKPTWDEMCFVKEKIWGPDAVVVQFHPKKSEYVNNHPFVLHLWRPIDQTIPTPPRELV